ncbi:MAG: CotH kinase family protein [Cyclobacteriaceae bacterium]|nr:CotH kinase family protein [Cyclobacteriaceae bacterium]
MIEKHISAKKISAFLISISMLLLLLFFAGNYNPVVDLSENPELEAVIRKKINRPEGIFYRTDLLNIYKLDASNAGIKKLDGIEILSKLTELNLQDNPIESLHPLASLDKLTRLNLQNTGIKNLRAIGFDALTKLPLKRLNLNNLESENPNGLKNEISDISLLQSLLNLERLYLRGNQITDISPLAGMRALEHLNLRENQVQSIESLQSLPALKYLNLHSNPEIPSLAPVGNLVQLKTLILRNVPVGDDLKFIENLTALQRLNIRNCQISDTRPLANLMARGALQDNWDQDVKAYLDIRDNARPEMDRDPYAPIRPYWNKIFYRKHGVLPMAISSLAPPQFSHTGGFHAEAFELTLSHPDPEVEIYYTLDGSEPDPNNLVGTTYRYLNQYKWYNWQKSGDFLSQSYRSYIYEGAISIYDRSDEPDKLTQISSTYHPNPAKFPGYFPKKPVHKGTVVRAMATKKNSLPSNIETHTYFIGENPYTLPVISLAVPEDRLFDYHYGIYVAGYDYVMNKNKGSLLDQIRNANYSRRGNISETRSNFEFLEEFSEKTKINLLSGIRIHGKGSRTSNNKSFKLLSDELYYNSSGFQSIFHDSLSPKIHKNIILRNGGNDKALTANIKDIVIQEAVKHLNFDTQTYRPAIIYLNGEYWGLLNLRDKIDVYYLNNKYGIDRNLIDLLTLHGKEKHGDNIKYFEVINSLNNSFANINIQELLKTKIDIENFFDYYIANIFSNNSDWPNNNIDFWRSSYDDNLDKIVPENDGKWRWIFYDLDYGFMNESYNKLDECISYREKTNNYGSQHILSVLLKDNTYKNQFINRFSDLLNSTFLTDRVIKIITKIKNEYEPEIGKHINRWKKPKSMEVWHSDIDIMINFAKKRPACQRSHIMDVFSIENQYNLLVNVNNQEAGIVKVNTLTISSDFPGIELNPYPWSGIYFSGIPITLKAIPKPGYRFVRWAELDNKNEEIEIIPDDDVQLTAIFEKIVS